MTNLIHNMHYTIGRANVSPDDLSIVHHDIIYNIRVFKKVKLTKCKKTNLAILNCATSS